MTTPFEIRTLSFKGNSFRIACRANGIPSDPSWFTFEDESDVRDRDWLIGSDDFVIDVGSGYGSYALTALAAGAMGVVCVNFNSTENEYLRESIRLNGWDEKVQILEKGLWSKTGFLNDVSLRFDSTEFDGSFPVRAWDDIWLHTLTGHKRIWMKLDVEGAELEVLRGARKFLDQYKPNLNIEVHRFVSSTLESELHQYLDSLGYVQISNYHYHSVSHVVYIAPPAQFFGSNQGTGLERVLF